jgi:hypothetical protein
MVSIDLQTHHATRASSLSGTTGMLTFPKAWFLKLARGWGLLYFILILSLHVCLQQLSHAMAWLTRSIWYSGLTPQYVNVLCSPAAWSPRQAPAPLYTMVVIPMVASIFLPGKPKVKRPMPTWITPCNVQCQHAGPIVGLSSMEEASFLPFALVPLQNLSLSKDTRPGPPSTSRYSCPLVVVLQDFATSPSFGDAGVWT